MASGGHKHHRASCTNHLDAEEAKAGRQETGIAKASLVSFLLLGDFCTPVDLLLFRAPDNTQK
jgi:hypothetical protein